MRNIAVVGLGYVGLPLAMALARRHPFVRGYDSDPRRIADLARGVDATGAVDGAALSGTSLALTADAADLAAADFFVVTVPTPIDENRRPDLGPLREASRTVGGALARGDVVVYESTVYPGVTEDVCGPILERASGLRAGVDFHLGYSPERVNPGDAEHTLERVKKIVAGDDPATTAVLEEVYGPVVEAGLHVASSIQVAEAAKVIENVQRDLNIALMNELAIIFDRMGLDTGEILDAAATKWNFHRYHPGLVGGHCIGVDPYYLTAKAELLGIHPQVILAGRRINDGMSAFVAERTVKLMIRAGLRVQGARVAVLGLAFKPGVGDARNSRVPEVVRELRDFGAVVAVHDDRVPAEEVERDFGLRSSSAQELAGVDAVVLATPHPELVGLAEDLARAGARVVVDVLSALDPARLPEGTAYWRL